MATITAGDTMVVRLDPESRGYCLSINGAGHCGIRFRAGDGWALLLYPSGLPWWLRQLLRAAWLATLAFPLGWWARRRWETGAAAAVAMTGLLVVPAFGLAPLGMFEWLGVSVGVVVGVISRRRLTARAAR